MNKLAIAIAMTTLVLACHQKEEPARKSAATTGSKTPTPAQAASPTDTAPPADPPATKAVRNDPEAYLRDIERVCFAEKHAGALDIETSARPLVVADWLGRNLETIEARDFLISLQPLPPAEKARRFRAEGKKAKLDDCPTAATWEQLTPSQ